MSLSGIGSLSASTPTLLQLPIDPPGDVPFLLTGLVSLLVTVAVVLALGYVVLRIWRLVREYVRVDRREQH